MKIPYTSHQGALNYLELLKGKLRGLLSISEWMYPRLYFPTLELDKLELFCPRFTKKTPNHHYKLTLKSRREIGNAMIRSILHDPEWTKAFEWVCLQPIKLDHWSATEVSFLDHRQRRRSYWIIPHIKACILKGNSTALCERDKILPPCSWCLFVFTIETWDVPQHGHVGDEDHWNWQNNCHKQIDKHPDLLKPVARSLLRNLMRTWLLRYLSLLLFSENAFLKDNHEKWANWCVHVCRYHCPLLGRAAVIFSHVIFMRLDWCIHM